MSLFHNFYKSWSAFLVCGWSILTLLINSGLVVTMLPPLKVASRRGRQRFQITREQLEYLRSSSFSWTAIADMLMVSRMTVYTGEESSLGFWLNLSLA